MHITSLAHVTARGDYKLRGKNPGYKEANNWGYRCFQSTIFVYVNFLLMIIPHAIPSFSIQVVIISRAN